MRPVYCAIGLWGLSGHALAEQPSSRTGGIERSTLIPVMRRDIMAIDDPTNDGWDSEVTARRVLEQVNTLLARDADEQELTAVIGPAFHCSPLRPSPLHTDFRDRTITVQRAAAPEDPTAPMTLAVFRAAWRAALPPGCDPDSVHVKVKVINITAALRGAFETRLRIERDVEGPAGPVCQTSHWRCGWMLSGNNPVPRLTSLTVQDFEESTRTGGVLFTGRTADVMHGDPAWTAQLSIGQPEWLRRMDTGVTLQQFGHHGLAIGDVNGDGLEDVYVCQPAGLPNRLLIHQPDGTVRDAAAAAGVDWLEPSMSALLADFDNDGDADLAVTAEQDVIFQANDGGGKFSSPVIAVRSHNFMSLSAADYDNDGDLDVYATAYYPNTAVPGRMAEPAPLHNANNGGQNVFLRNDSTKGSLKFTDITTESGLDENNSRWSFGAAWEDFDEDGDQDLAVANDFGPLNLYRNGAGKFKDVARVIGLEQSSFGMSAAWGDYDRDGLMDLYVGGMFTAAGSRIVPQQMFRRNEAGGSRGHFLAMTTGNALFRNAGAGKFTDISAASNSQMGRWAWASPFVDLNNDGWEDILVTNGWLTNDRTDDL